MILVAIGANLPTKDGATALQTCVRVAGALDGIAGLSLRQVSRWYETAPIPPSGQPPYINGMARLDGMCDPAALLTAMHELEASSGRQRSIPNAARTIDLDLIEHHGLIRQASKPILPHPRCHERAFVLRPLLEIAPDWRHPILHRSAASLLAELPNQVVVALAKTGGTL